jgi:hypothetical protein
VLSATPSSAAAWLLLLLLLQQLLQTREQLPGEDNTYKLAWNLDAAITRRCLTVGHMKELARIMERHLEVRTLYCSAAAQYCSATALHGVSCTFLHGSDC